MKLISLYIENFGGLSRYSLDFGSGLTVVEAANGFGKTTLAEFLRAMFYGFPRKGKTLDKSRRQKYTPWNGGKFGGNLVFEAEGVRYRLERGFGATPKGDTFQLIDLTTNKKSTRFSEEIGLELFGLDGDAFERSTYLPQMAEVGNLTTDSIRSKLSNLLEDTNDVGNFEKAMAALKTRRSSYIPYRGSGGSVMQAHSRVSQLQEQLRRTESMLPELAECEMSIGQLEQQNELLRAKCEQIRQEIRRASEAAVIASVHRQEQDLALRLEESRGKLRSLEEKYPAGIPGTEETEKARQALARLEILRGRTVTESEDLEAEAVLEENRARFEERTPSREELENCRSQCSAYFSTLAEARSKGLSAGEREQYERLLPRFEAGLLEAERLEALTKTRRELEEKKHRRAALELAGEDAQKLQELEGYFAPGLPEEKELEEKREQLEQLRRLREERESLKDSAAQRPQVKASPLPMILLLILGTAAAAVGIVLLVQRQMLWGGIALGAGVLSLVGAVFAGIRMMRDRELEIAIRAEQQMIATHTRRIRDLEQPIRAFTARYSSNDMMGAALYEIRDNQEDYLALQEKDRQIREKQSRLEEEMAALTEILNRELGEGDFSDSILMLHRDRERMLSLRQELQQAEREAAALNERAERELEQIRVFLGSYGNPEPEDLQSALAELERSSDAYRRAAVRVAKWQEEKARHESELEAWDRELKAFFEASGLEMLPDAAAQLLEIRDDRKDWEEETAEAERFEAELEQFRREQADRLAQPLPETAEDPAALREKEVRLNLDLSRCADELLRKKQQRRQIKAQTEQIPQLQDDLQMWQEKKQGDQHSADILDDTMAFLEQAKENLSHSYLGPIRQSFGSYMEKLWGQTEGQMLVTQDLEVQLERYGQTRELGYFSAGQSDLVMLCMRLALVDALFEEENPFVILDDPFVNLDDAHTEQALQLLKELSQNRQILYLTCSSSRKPQ